MRLPIAIEDNERDFDDWRWQSRHATTDLMGLEKALRLTDDERRGAERALAGGFPIAITPYYLSLIDPDDPACPIRLQVVPSAREGIEVPGDLRDPLGEESHEVAPELVQRYPDRALLLASDRCAVYCRFCTRSRMVGDGGGARSLKKLTPALDYLKAHPEIRDVIVSGGDPMVMGTNRLRAILMALAEIPHLNTVRLATRAPVTIPQRVTEELVDAIKDAHPAIFVMTHFNHPKEITDASRLACRRLVNAGLPVMNQSVLLRGVNDQAEILETLFRGLVGLKVRPYYLLQADPVRGTGHLRTPLSVGVRIMERLQGRMSGIALPKFIVDTPHGRGKVPVGPKTIVSHEDGRTQLLTFRGEIVEYVDPPTTSHPGEA